MKLKLVAAAAILTLSSPMAWAAGSSFQNSCQNITMSTSDEGVTIKAECRTTNGDYKTSSMRYTGMINNNGRLETRRGERTTYQHSCRDRGISWNENKFWIRAICKTVSGTEKEARYEVQNIQNINGKLRFVAD